MSDQRDTARGRRTEAGGRPGSADEAPETFQGTVETITYHDTSSLFAVLRLDPDPGFKAPVEGSLFTPGRVTAVGKIADPVEGVRLRLEGRWGRHASHGAQFEFASSEPLPPATEEGLVRYLSSKAFEGIGPTIARRIVDKLGADALERIAEDPGALKGVKGLRADIAEDLAQAVRERSEQHRVFGFLAQLGLGPLTAQAVLGKLGPDCEDQIGRNPYVLTIVPTVGFLTADRVAKRLGLAPDDPRRLRAVTRHVLDRATGEGHVMLPLEELLTRSARALEGAAPREAFVKALDEMEDGLHIVIDRAVLPEPPPFDEDETDVLEGSGRFRGALPCYLPRDFDHEVELARGLGRLLAQPARPLADEDDLARAESAASIELHPGQRDAVLELLRRPVSLLTGGPGVGKTTIVRFVAQLAEHGGAEVLLASPTGRAAKRLSEATGRPASTLHRLLRFVPNAGGFEHGPDKPLAGGLVIVDEVSMLDAALARRLVDAIAAPTRLVFVGDPDQLPSVGAGNVLSDLLDSGRVPVARLTQVFRQSTRSLIVSNAHRVLAGEMPELPGRGVTDADFYFFPVDGGPERIAERVVEVTTQRIPKTFGLEWSEDVQVLAPMYKGPAGVDALNDGLREALSAGGREVFFEGSVWRTGDRVVQTRNDYDREVFNGDLGRIVRVDQSGTVTVKFPEREVAYERGALADLKPAFAMTVHRSQGGEFPAVVCPLSMQHSHMLQRNLFYTAITRAKRLVVLVGERAALARAIQNTDQAQRRTLLATRLRALPSTHASPTAP
ncbi:MAG: ATP-dependent RecD-like DNA helicase [Planctomycetota bacterium]